MDFQSTISFGNYEYSEFRQEAHYLTFYQRSKSAAP